MKSWNLLQSGSLLSKWKPFLPASSSAGLNFGASHNLNDDLNTAFGLQKPYVMHHLVGKILVIVLDDGGELILNPNNDEFCQSLIYS